MFKISCRKNLLKFVLIKSNYIYRNKALYKIFVSSLLLIRKNTKLDIDYINTRLCD